jgi:hypothetical protein
MRWGDYCGIACAAGFNHLSGPGSAMARADVTLSCRYAFDKDLSPMIYIT